MVEWYHGGLEYRTGWQDRYPMTAGSMAMKGNKKFVYGWFVDWGPNTKGSRYSIDLFFSSPSALTKCCSCIDHTKEVFVKVEVDEDFDYLDFVPDNY